MATTQLSNQPPRSPERDALAAAIIEAAEAKSAEIAARDGVQRATRMAEQAAAKLEATSADAVKVKDAQATRMAEAATKGTPLTPDRSMRDARAREADAQDDLDAARAALASIEAALVEAGAVLVDAQERVDTAVGAVMATGALQLLAEVEALQTRLVDERIVLWSLTRGVLGKDAAGQTISDSLGRPFLMPELNRETRPAYDAWRAVREALRESADAPLPA